MASSFNKEVFRSIKGTLSRFIAISLMVALGAGFYAGLRMTSPDMKLAADAYYDDTRLYDIRVLSTLGLSEEDVRALEDLEEVEAVMPAYQSDFLVLIGDEQYALRAHSLDIQAATYSNTTDETASTSDDDASLNRPILVEGRWPEGPGECVLSADRVMESPLQIGDTLEVSEGLQDVDVLLTSDFYTVVGLVNSPEYSSPPSLGYTSLGSGYLQQYMYLAEECFVDGLPYTEAFVTVRGAREKLSGGDSYRQIVLSAQEAIEAIASKQEEARYTQVKADAQEEYDAAYTEYEEERSKTEAELEEAKTSLDEVAAQIAAAFAAAEAFSGTAGTPLGQAGEELQAKQLEYEESLASYEEARTEAEEGFANAESELAEIQKEIDSIEYPSWYVMDRTKNLGAESFQSDAGRIDQIARVFPLLFFLVAALVALTTMTRMVDEERMLIGTYKALGYSKLKIASKYMLYALLASGIGSIVGIAILSQILPKVILQAYSIVYSIPTGPTPIDLPLALLSAAMGIGVTLVATASAIGASLREKPAALMLPRAPKPGKRIFLEHVGPVWRRVSFSWKVTLRNIFRYKQRFFMTLIGIAGCTALLLTGLGLFNAVNDIIPKQFDDIYNYNASVKLDPGILAEDQEKLDALLQGNFVYRSAKVYEEGFKAVDEAGKEYAVTLIAPEDVEGFVDFVDLRNRRTQEDLALSDTSLIISEKLASKLGVAVGDTLDLYSMDETGNLIGEAWGFTVGGICENYVGAYVYTSPAYLEKLWGETPSLSTLLLDATSEGSERKELSSELLAIEGVTTVGYNDEAIEFYQTSLKSVDSVVAVLVGAALILAFVVLYNLTNININERQREIATLKVLGFTPREVDAYIFRETILLTVMGALLGLVLGIFMSSYVVTTAEVDAVMFGRDIHTSSFLIAFFLTLLFSILVAFAMRRKLKAIDMVESLKSVE